MLLKKNERIKSKNLYFISIFLILLILLDFLVLEKISNLYYWTSICVFLICFVMLGDYIIVIYKFKKKIIDEEDIINEFLGEDVETQKYLEKVLDYLTLFPKKQKSAQSIIIDDENIDEKLDKSIIFHSSWKMTLFVKMFVLILILISGCFTIMSIGLFEAHRFFIIGIFMMIILFFPQLLPLIFLSIIEIRDEGIYVKHFMKTSLIPWSNIDKVGEVKKLCYPKIGWIKYKDKFLKEKYIWFLLERFAIDTINKLPTWRWHISDSEIIKFIKERRKIATTSFPNNKEEALCTKK